MDTKRLWSAAAVIGVVLIVGFVLSVPQVRDLGARPAPVVATSTPVVYFHDVYKKGMHTITAKIALPDACTNISGQASAPTDTVTLAFDMPADTDICLQEVATTTLSLTVAANAGATITASINGNNASTSSY